jgi:hypothetical protein
MQWYVSGTKKQVIDHLYNFLYRINQNNYFPIVKWQLITLSVLLHTVAFSQQLNGVWKGTLTQQAGGCFPVYNVELQVNIINNKVAGFCYHYSDVLNYVKKNYNGFYNAATKTIDIQEEKVTTFHIPSDCTPCIRYFSLAYSNSGNKEILSGDWGGVVMNGTAPCTPGKITLHRVAQSDFNHIQEIKVDTGMIRLDFYDNAEIDGDSITVTLDNRPLLSHQKLGLKPLTLEVKVDLDHREQEITMIADNLGTIPPNTAMVIITAADRKYRLFLKSDKQRSAQVRVIYEDPRLASSN